MTWIATQNNFEIIDWQHSNTLALGAPLKIPLLKRILVVGFFQGRIQFEWA